MESITIAIPTYNEEKYLPDCLTAIRNQSYKNKFELLVIDNNSTDNTARIAKSFGARVVKESQKGSLFAKHCCFSQARGDIVVTTDADSVPPYNWLSCLLAPFEKDDKVIAVTGLVKYPDNTTVKFNFSSFDQFCQKTINRFLSSPITMRAPNRAILKNVYFASGGIDVLGAPSEDEYFLVKKLRKFGKIVFLPDLIVQTSDRRQKNRDFSYLFVDLLWKLVINGHIRHFFHKPNYITIKDYR
ncbi:hypothetical protein A2960_05650 [Candidatus Gottesmanbacteria bacterium RIFCSPLOWO2_01_FULL_39_12b]|uniref:Glycosyltransferase 2-like domain-containing protein n=1 Tax=Candidatus Gottesmanbacteria bacterium RIFCSPLOWO2_01_FULL_39_12b TaxID=1798388 RepID=A0A1F6AMS8_9BACT|nr:MAG: hypothetical protein A2960_05650 [Candidatus Gottesmanbacteria bacterium RIFCSPLOWO2_01_FULL_39_12b]